MLMARVENAIISTTNPAAIPTPGGVYIDYENDRNCLSAPSLEKRFNDVK